MNKSKGSETEEPLQMQEFEDYFFRVADTDDLETIIDAHCKFAYVYDNRLKLNREVLRRGIQACFKSNRYVYCLGYHRKTDPRDQPFFFMAYISEMSVIAGGYQAGGMIAIRLRSHEGKHGVNEKVSVEMYRKRTPILGVLPQISHKLYYGKFANGQTVVETGAKNSGLIKNLDKEFWQTRTDFSDYPRIEDYTDTGFPTRLASVSDLNALMPLFQANCEKMGLTWAKYLTAIIQILTDSDLGFVLLAQSQGRVVGFVAFAHSYFYMTADAQLKLQGMQVAQDATPSQAKSIIDALKARIRAHVPTLAFTCLSVAFIVHKSTMERTLPEVEAFNLKKLNYSLWEKTPESGTRPGKSVVRPKL